MELKEILHRFEVARQTPETVAPNCIGTALYAAGIEQRDCGVDLCSTFSLLHHFKEAAEPELGHVVVWGYTEKITQGRKKLGNTTAIIHAAVVTTKKPLLVSERVSTNGRIRFDHPIQEIDGAYLNEQSVTELLDMVFYREFFRKFLFPAYRESL